MGQYKIGPIPSSMLVTQSCQKAGLIWLEETGLCCTPSFLLVYLRKMKELCVCNWRLIKAISHMDSQRIALEEGNFKPT